MNKGLNEEWKKAILSGERIWIRQLCCIEKNKRWIDHNRDFGESICDTQELYDFVIMYFVPLERFIFIVDFCGESPTEHTLEWASRCAHWDIVNYLHERGFRHTKSIMLDHHLDYLLYKKVPEEYLISIIICYVGTPLGKILEGDKRYNLAYAKAAVRKKYAQKAVASLVLLKRQGLFCKDLMRMIVQRVGSYECMSKKEWEEYPMKYREAQIWEKKKLTPFQYAAIAGFLLIFLWGRFK